MVDPELLQRVTGKFEAGDGCWLWKGFCHPEGYGRITVSGKSCQAHRVVYELLVGPIPEGFDLDHQCHNDDLACDGGTGCPHRACVRPDHLVPRSRAENIRRGRVGEENRRKQYCPQGHPYDAENTYVLGNRRSCRTCHRERNRAWARKARRS